MQVVRKDKISETVSVYLDGLRIIAAALVYLSHEKRESLTGGFLRPLGSFGHEGVVIFFIVSGFVICHATTGRRDDFRGYCIARLARLWSVVLPALCLTVCLDLAGSRVAPQAEASTRQPRLRRDRMSFPCTFISAKFIIFKVESDNVSGLDSRAESWI